MVVGVERRVFRSNLETQPLTPTIPRLQVLFSPQCFSFHLILLGLGFHDCFTNKPHSEPVTQRGGLPPLTFAMI